MGKFIDLTGQRFERLTVLKRDSYTGPASDGVRVKWICVCDCGCCISATARNLRTGNTKSCGCLKADIHAARLTTHGRSDSRTYRIWQGMISRCETPSSTSYRFYGAKGVSVCDEWHSFERFYADMGECPVGLTIERVESTGNYEPGNCVWATAAAQRLNLRTNIEWNGESLPATEIARRNGVPRTSLVKLLAKGLTISAALDHALKHRQIPRNA